MGIKLESQALGIDCSLGEGGGQAIRTALGLACAFGVPVRLFNMRAGREIQGLSHQHVSCVRALSAMCGAQVHGLDLGAKEMTFLPRWKPVASSYDFEIQTAGSATLLLQSVMLPLAISGGKNIISARGGTHVMKSPTFEYFSEVFCKSLAHFGISASAKISSYGFYPKGGGQITVEMESAGLSKIKAEKPKFEEIRKTPEELKKIKINASIVSCGIPAHVAQREREAILSFFPNAAVAVSGARGTSAGNAVTLWHGNFGSCAFGKVGTRAEEVAKVACDLLQADMLAGGGMDLRLADQLLPYLAMLEAAGSTNLPRISKHVATNAHIINSFFPNRIAIAQSPPSVVWGGC